MVFTALNFIERRASDIYKATFHQGPLITEEESEDQSANVGAINIGIGHDNDAVITQILLIKFLAFNTQAQGCDQGLDFRIFIDLGVVCFFNI